MKDQTEQPQPVGAPPIINENLIKEVANNVMVGDPIRVAAVLAGISTRTYHKWQARGERDIESGRRTLYAEFVHRIEKAHAQGNESFVALPLANAAKDGDVRAAIFMATHQYAADWQTAPTHIDMTSDGKPLTNLPAIIRIENVTDEVIRASVEAAEAAHEDTE